MSTSVPGDLRSLYETARWRRVRSAYLRLHPRCAAQRHERACDGRATVVDHIIPRSTARTPEELHHLTWNRGNWQPLSKPCHDAKTRREHGWGHTNAESARQQSSRVFPIHTQAPTRPSRVVRTDYSARRAAS